MFRFAYRNRGKVDCLDFRSEDLCNDGSSSCSVKHAPIYTNLRKPGGSHEGGEAMRRLTALRIFACSPFMQSVEAVVLDGISFAGNCITTTSLTRVGPYDSTPAMKIGGVWREKQWMVERR
jgi:hypothetical protein